jgi:transcriptional regulator with XRE-family HTH domain
MRINDQTLKKSVGLRFRKFREALKKTQYDLAAELQVYQSTITNIELGKTFPKINYLHHLHNKYRLNLNWLLREKGDMFLPKELNGFGISFIGRPHVKYGDPMYDKYVELFTLMQIQVIEQVILAKLVELKALMKDEVKEFYERIKREQEQKKEETGEAE